MYSDRPIIFASHVTCMLHWAYIFNSIDRHARSITVTLAFCINIHINFVWIVTFRGIYAISNILSAKSNAWPSISIAWIFASRLKRSIKCLIKMIKKTWVKIYVKNILYSANRQIVFHGKYIDVYIYSELIDYYIINTYKY